VLRLDCCAARTGRIVFFLDRPAETRDVPAAIGFGAAWLSAFWLEVPWINGPPYWPWPWRSLALMHVLALHAAPLLGFAVFAWLWARSESLNRARAVQIALGLTLCQVLVQWSGLRTEPGAWSWLDHVVRSPTITGYYTDASKIDDLRAFLHDYPQLALEDHSSTHPPGPILFYWVCLKAFGPAAAASLGGVLVAILASTGVAVAYVFAGIYTGDPKRRVSFCFVYALMPALVMFTPSFDQIYPMFTMATLLLWHRSFSSTRAAFWLGLSLFASTMMAYQFTLLVIPLSLHALGVLRAQGWSTDLRRSMQRSAAVAIGVATGAYLLLWALSGFNALDSFLAAVVRQLRYAAFLQRPYLASLFFAPYDFVLGNGVLALPLAALYFLRGRRAELERTVAAVGLLAILIVDLTGLLRCETSRIWLFLNPLLLAPAALGLADLSGKASSLLLAMQALILISIKCKLAIMVP
jgi:hypothetical protein